MKKMLFTLVTMLTIAVSANAMSYEQARREALFLTDKMAYELNLTDAQYEAAYEINLDYLMGVTSQSDVFGLYWERRNLDISYILYSWQWDLFRAATYFYRPLYWEAGYWHFGIYARYPHRDYFYFGRPHFYATYRGGHAWHAHGSHGYYYGHRDHYRPAHHGNHFGMHDRWDRGDFRNPSHHSSTRVTGRPSNRVGYDNRPSDRRHDNNGINRRPESRPNNGSMERRPGGSTMERRPENRSNSGNFGGSRVGRGGVDSNRPYTNFGNSRNGSSSHSGSIGSSHSSGSHSSGSHSGNFGGNRSGSSHSGGSHSGSFGGSRSGGSHSGGSHSSMGSSTRSGGGGSHGGGGHFGGRR